MGMVPAMERLAFLELLLKMFLPGVCEEGSVTIDGATSAACLAHSWQEAWLP
jgi:hypothetical protein